MPLPPSVENQLREFLGPLSNLENTLSGSRDRSVLDRFGPQADALHDQALALLQQYYDTLDYDEYSRYSRMIQRARDGKY